MLYFVLCAAAIYTRRVVVDQPRSQGLSSFRSFEAPDSLIINRLHADLISIKLTHTENRSVVDLKGFLVAFKT